MNRLILADWKDLTHAYGTAEDVPALLADLNSPNPLTRENALSELFGTIWHQGTVYPATVKAVPELLALFKSPTCEDREGIAALLASIADGNGYYNVHSRYSSLRPSIEKILAERGTSIAAEIKKENEYLQIIREMSVEFMPSVEGYIGAAEPAVREIVARAMIRYFDVFPHYKELVHAQLEAEGDDGARETIAHYLNDHWTEKTINSIRELYIDRFTKEIARLRGERSERVYTEAALRRADGGIAREGPSQLGMRVDAVIPANGETVRIDSTTTQQFEPTTTQPNSMEFRLHPFQWDRCVITLECGHDSFSFQEIVDWFDRWFDLDDENLPDDHGICEVVHFLDEPRFSEGRVSITADLGTAPIDAFYELLDACAASRPTNTWVSNTATEEMPVTRKR